MALVRKPGEFDGNNTFLILAAAIFIKFPAKRSGALKPMNSEEMTTNDENRSTNMLPLE